MDEIQAKQYASERPFIKSAILDKFIRWLVDSGASLTCICDELFSLFRADQVEQRPLPLELTIMAASGHLFEIQGIYEIPIKFKNVTYRHPVVVIRNLAAKAILGADFLVKWNANLDFLTSRPGVLRAAQLLVLSSTRRCHGDNQGLT